MLWFHWDSLVKCRTTSSSLTSGISFSLDRTRCAGSNSSGCLSPVSEGGKEYPERSLRFSKIKGSNRNPRSLNRLLVLIKMPPVPRQADRYPPWKPFPLCRSKESFSCSDSIYPAKLLQRFSFQT